MALLGWSAMTASRMPQRRWPEAKQGTSRRSMLETANEQETKTSLVSWLQRADERVTKTSLAAFMLQRADEQFSVQVVCRDIGMAGGRALLRDPASDPSLDETVAALASSEILADSLVCEGTEIFLRDCSFRGEGEPEGSGIEPDRTGEREDERF